MKLINLTEMKLKFSKSEIQSGSTRIDWAEGLILQLPQNHDGRNSWLINYGIREESQTLRDKWQFNNKQTLKFNEKTQCWDMNQK